MIDCLRSFCLAKSRVAAPSVTLGLFSVMLQCVIVNCVTELSVTRMPTIKCFGVTRIA